MPTLFLFFLFSLFFLNNTLAAFSHNQQLRQELEQIIKLPDQIASHQNAEKISDNPDNSDQKIINEETSDEISTQTSSIEKRRIRKSESSHSNPILENNHDDFSEDPFEVNPLDNATDNNDDKRRKRKSK